MENKPYTYDTLMNINTKNNTPWHTSMPDKQEGGLILAQVSCQSQPSCLSECFFDKTNGKISLMDLNATDIAIGPSLNPNKITWLNLSKEINLAILILKDDLKEFNKMKQTKNILNLENSIHNEIERLSKILSETEEN
jgi:hypothetical protein